MSRYDRPARACPRAPYWLSPTPCPKPPPTNTYVEPWSESEKSVLRSVRCAMAALTVARKSLAETISWRAPARRIRTARPVASLLRDRDADDAPAVAARESGVDARRVGRRPPRVVRRVGVVRVRHAAEVGHGRRQPDRVVVGRVAAGAGRVERLDGGAVVGQELARSFSRSARSVVGVTAATPR